MPSPPGLLKRLSLRSATALVVANIIGAGIFTTTGFQAADLGHPGYIFLLWIVGGILALCGALCYAELGAAMPEAGAEYHYLRQTYGLALGFMSAFVSLIAGFSAAIAAASKALIRYLGHFLPALIEGSPIAGVSITDWGAMATVWLLVIIHLRGSRGGIGFNDWITLFKVIGIVGILVAAAIWGRGDLANLSTVSKHFESMDTPTRLAALGTSLIFVSFCYTGWNAAAYVAAEMKEPQRQLPRALLAGTGLVVVLYLGLNAVYLYGANVDELAGTVEVGVLSGRKLFGPSGAGAVTAILSLSILASISAMTIAGPRVYYAFGRDLPAASWLTRVGPTTGAPWAALLLQGVVTTALILSGTVDQIQQYAGFTLSLFSSLAVSCVIVLRWRKPEMTRPFRAWGYPFTPLLFLAISIWTMAWAVRGRPVESSLALLTVALGGLLFWLLFRSQRQARSSEDTPST